MKTIFKKIAKFLSASAIWALIAIFYLVSARNVLATNYLTINLSNYSNGQIVPYCQASYDSIKYIPPIGVSVTVWSASGAPQTMHGDTLVLSSGSSGSVTCFYIGGQQLITSRPVSVPTIPVFHDDTVCGIETLVLNQGYNIPMQFYSYIWNSGATTSVIVVSAGTYWVKVSNACGTTFSDTITITQYNVSKPELGPDITLCQGLPVILDPGTYYSNYLWTPGGTIDSSLSPLSSGTYIVQTTNTVGGCVDRDTVNVTFLSPPVQDISLVTIDTTNGNNRITWDNSQFGSATTANIYRELTTNNYVLVGTAAYSDAAWTDSVNSRHQAWRYKLSLTDTCGNEGAQSPYVQSIHCYVVPIIGGGFNVTWTPYLIEGVTDPVTQYNIYSGDQLNQLTYQTYVSGNVNTYTLSAFADSLYVVGAVLSTKAASDDALSNWVSQQDALGIENNAELEFSFSPNPVLTTLSIQCDKSISTLTVYDLTGRLLLNSNGSSIDCSALPAGMYHCVITTDDGLQSVLRFVKLD